VPEPIQSLQPTDQWVPTGVDLVRHLQLSTLEGGGLMKVRTCLAGLVFLFSGALGANDRLSIRVSPAVAFAPANLVIRTTVEADSSNRAIEIVAESPDFYRSSEIRLDGERAPRTTMFEFRSLPSGAYSVRAVLKGQGGHKLATVERTVNIVEGMTPGR
jgi:hypothetical protein